MSLNNWWNSFQNSFPFLCPDIFVFLLNTSYSQMYTSSCYLRAFVLSLYFYLLLLKIYLFGCVRSGSYLRCTSLGAPCVWNLSFLTRGWTHIPSIGRWILTTGQPGSPSVAFRCSLIHSHFFLLSTYLLLICQITAEISIYGRLSSQAHLFSDWIFYTKLIIFCFSSLNLALFVVISLVIDILFFSLFWGNTRIKWLKKIWYILKNDKQHIFFGKHYFRNLKQHGITCPPSIAFYKTGCWLDPFECLFLR